METKHGVFGDLRCWQGSPGRLEVARAGVDEQTWGGGGGGVGRGRFRRTPGEMRHAGSWTVPRKAALASAGGLAMGAGGSIADETPPRRSSVPSGQAMPRTALPIPASGQRSGPGLTSRSSCSSFLGQRAPQVGWARSRAGKGMKHALGLAARTEGRTSRPHRWRLRSSRRSGAPVCLCHGRNQVKLLSNCRSHCRHQGALPRESTSQREAKGAAEESQEEPRTKPSLSCRTREPNPNTTPARCSH